jgi:hypothetical protein
MDRMTRAKEMILDFVTDEGRREAEDVEAFMAERDNDYEYVMQEMRDCETGIAWLGLHWSEEHRLLEDILVDLVPEWD